MLHGGRPAIWRATVCNAAREEGRSAEAHEWLRSVYEAAETRGDAALISEFARQRFRISYG